MNAQILSNIKQRLSLRQPLQDALDITAAIADKVSLSKAAIDQDNYLNNCLEAIQSVYPACTDFQREFPSVSFSIATGVGKTRLMGACIAYLYLEKGVRNFFILAPNLTIYEKLIRDFGDPSYHKYVFNGIAEFVHNRPVIITGDNYAQQGSLYAESEIRINIFNISKFNSDNKGTKKDGVSLAPKIKRLSEYLGESYWSYLSGLDKLVILMDEAHRYHADASKAAINELKPVLGLELTATPFDEKGKPFKNVVYKYNLAQALADGQFVKNPAIAKRKNFEKGNLTEKEIEIIKLEDAISVHQDTKVALELYAKTNKVKQVKPFILVVCKDINHATETYHFINSPEFYNGEFIGKVLQIDSSTKKEEDIEKQFISLEDVSNEIEIVIHVNMLKEGWDVTNLYTIVPLRAANAGVLIEQTIGRGLRLPYDGKRTGEDKIDKLTIIAHDNFDAVIAEAQNPNSILNKVSFVELDTAALNIKTEVVTAIPAIEQQLHQEQQKVDTITDVQQKQRAQNQLDAKKAIISVLPGLNKSSLVKNVQDLSKPEVKQEVIKRISETLNQGQGNLFALQILEDAEEEYETAVTAFRKNIIEIPRMDLVQGEIEVWFEDFDLDCSNINFKALDEEIIRMGLKDKQVETLGVRSSGSYGDPVNLIISELLNFPEIDYDDNAELLYKLATQAYEVLAQNLDGEKEIRKTVFQFKTIIATRIYDQMTAHFRLNEPEYIAPNVLPFTKIEQHNFSALAENGYRDYRDIISPVSLIPKLIFRGFIKACHFEYKFESKAEQDFAFVLENDTDVKKWLRPAPNQFRIYWHNNSRRYEPDFVVETEDTIYIVEPKSSANLKDADVLAKKAAAEKYCKYATEYNLKHGGKTWKYLLVPHNEISRTVSFRYLVSKFSAA
ncbi:MAG: DEAD/DEAH box helicase family protein [Bacteroidetes bacterium]|nr:DEAD/DEAH box helicase family protein [Bacteroidota bacterium]